MNAVIERLLTYIPSGYDKQAHDVPALSLSGNGNITLNDLTLYVSSASTSAIDLHAQTVSQVAAQLPPGVTGTVFQDGPAELLLWPNGYGNPQTGMLPVTLTIATSPLWQLLATFARAFTERRRNLQNAVNQINVRAAVGMWLDWWGASLGIPRVAGEPDTLYVRRLVGMTLQPHVNNAAIEQLAASLGYALNITDSSPGRFQADINFPANPSGGFIYSQSQIASIINQVKAAGVIAIVNFLAALNDGMGLSDNVLVTSPTGRMVWSVSKWGEATWA